MEKENLQLYVNLMNKYEEQAKMGITMVFTSDEKNLMSYMKKMAIKDEELKAFLNSLTNMTPMERYEAIDRRFNKKKEGIIITLAEVKDYKELIDEKSKEDKNKLNYLINNYSRLNVQGIRLDDMKYIDENGEFREVDMNDNIVPFRKEEKEEIEKIDDIDDIEVPLRSRRSYDEIDDYKEDIEPAPVKGTIPLKIEN